MSTWESLDPEEAEYRDAPDDSDADDTDFGDAPDEWRDENG